MTGMTARVLAAIVSTRGRAVTAEEVAGLLDKEPHRIGPALWHLTQRGELVRLPGFPWWAQRWGTTRLWSSWGR